jgi:hypothetical protein
MMLKLPHLFFMLLLVSQLALAEETPKAGESSVDESSVTTLLWPDGTRYVGGVKEGKRSGKGTIFWQDGTRFVGTFVNDKRNGPGTMILPDGTVYNGYFEEDTLVERSESFAQSEPTAPVAEISAADLTTTQPDTETMVAAATPPAANQTAETEATGTTSTEQKTTPEQALESATLTPAMRQDVQAAVDLWARAWSDQDVEQYLSAYASDFVVPGRQSRRQWEGLRRSRLTRPSRIEVSLSYDLFELLADNQVLVDFTQVYDSNLFSDKTRKRLLLKKQGEQWRITSEQSL